LAGLAVQREGVSVGIWMFLASEILFLSGLFITYAIYQSVACGIDAFFARDFSHGSQEHQYALASGRRRRLAWVIFLFVPTFTDYLSRRPTASAPPAQSAAIDPMPRH
jgi:heme/copper-type cytochrome/quinol oxidase subunit 3